MIMVERNTMSIKYYEQILLLEDNIIDVKMDDTIIKVRGKDLQITYYTNIEIVVHGVFSSVTFQ